MVNRLSVGAFGAPGSRAILFRKTLTVGTSAVQALKANKERAGYRVIGAQSNSDNVYHDHDANVSTSSEDVIVPGGRLEDEGEWETIYRGEVWLISGTAGQSVTIEEIRRR